MSDMKEQFRYRLENNELNSLKELEEFELLLREKATQGDAEAQYNLAELLHHLCVCGHRKYHITNKEIIDWLEKAADQQHANGLYYLASCYRNGKKIPKNLKLYVQYLTQAAQLGHLEAMSDLALCYSDGVGVNANLKEAFSWLRASSHQGNLMDQLSLMNCYFKGIGVDKDIKKAIHYGFAFVRHGNTHAQGKLDDWFKKIDFDKKFTAFICWAELKAVTAKLNKAGSKKEALSKIYDWLKLKFLEMTGKEYGTFLAFQENRYELLDKLRLFPSPITKIACDYLEDPNEIYAGEAKEESQSIKNPLA